MIERVVRNDEVVGLIPICSTIWISTMVFRISTMVWGPKAVFTEPVLGRRAFWLRCYSCNR